MAVESKIKQVLGHLAWLEDALRNPDTPETPYRKALLTLNAATLLQWDLTFPEPAADAIPGHTATTGEAKDLVAVFTDAVREHVRQAEPLTSDNATAVMGTLADETKALLEALTSPNEAPPAPRREPELEVAIDPAELITHRVNQKAEEGLHADHDGNLPAAATPPSRQSEQYRQYLEALVQACSAKRLFDEGKLPADAYATIRRSCADALERAIASADSEGSGLTRLRTLARPVVESLRRPVKAQAGSKGS